jgi:hypothetical protein
MARVAAPGVGAGGAQWLRLTRGRAARRHPQAEAAAQEGEAGPRAAPPGPRGPPSQDQERRWRLLAAQLAAGPPHEPGTAGGAAAAQSAAAAAAARRARFDTNLPAAAEAALSALARSGPEGRFAVSQELLLAGWQVGGT